jgi:hypothetical protein
MGQSIWFLRESDVIGLGIIRLGIEWELDLKCGVVLDEYLEVRSI